ncbi:hypothetical protein QR680_007370 [Steinernema hermaphroditum]|uniref:Uncharacterized protein n=1 Tax=Steinernema hermaphroditum TaxID=289476 RepID=A0AA39M621_9BILA|nr:hypothetical protein QR680_007367 [Steinernema hermaphroditum]KAK0422108.1 hypothetical protein QR680_007370 [Steinernema hermaphroditum]
MADEYPTIYLRETRDIRVYSCLLKLHKLNHPPKARADKRYDICGKHSPLVRKMLINNYLKHLLENPDPAYEFPLKLKVPRKGEISEEEEEILRETISRRILKVDAEKRRAEMSSPGKTKKAEHDLAVDAQNHETRGDPKNHNEIESAEDIMNSLTGVIEKGG